MNFTREEFRIHIQKSHIDQMLKDFNTVKEEVNEESKSETSEESWTRPINANNRILPLGWRRFYLDPPI